MVNNDGEDVNDDSTVAATVRVDCVECGREFHGGVGSDRCPPCAALQGNVPAAPCCVGMKLRGVRARGQWAFECSVCDATYSIETVQTWAFGLKCRRIVVDACRFGHLSMTMDTVVLRAALSVGIALHG